MDIEKIAISARDVSIKFGDIVANDMVSLEIKKGEIMGILGENGAGKSTLMKIVYGLYTRESGEIFVNGRCLPPKYSPADAIDLGVSMVPQHFMLVDAFTVAENIVLGEEHRINRYLVDTKKTNELVANLCTEFGLNVSPEQKVEKLPLGAKQKIEILKALYRNTNILILDEPTTVLTPQEVDDLFVLLREFQNRGMTIVIISHKLHELLAITDRITVMRAGKIVRTFMTSETNAEELAQAMVGRDLDKLDVHSKSNLDDANSQPAISLHNVSTRFDGVRCSLKNLSLDLYPGKIIGIAGIDGNGQTELVELLSGVKPLECGHIQVDDKQIAENTVSTMRALGIGVIPEDRIEMGLVTDLSILENILLGYKGDKRFERFGVFRFDHIKDYVNQLINDYDVRPARRRAVCKFVSGGNQQKVVLARELERPGLRAVVASQPVRGLDVGAIVFTHQTLLNLREEGKAVLLISSDLDEILSLSDEVAVLRSGEIVVQRPASEFTRDEIGLYMGGGGECVS